MIPLALSRGDVANYVNALFTVYIILIFVNILISWLPRVPYNRVLRAVLDFVSETTNPYLNLFRRFLPPIGGGGFGSRPQPDAGDHRAVLAATGLRRPDRRVSAGGARAWRLAGALCGLIVVADQAAKAAIEAHLVPGQHVSVLGPLGLTLTHNTGVAFGLAGGAGAGLVVVTLAALTSSVVFSGATPRARGCGSPSASWPAEHWGTSPIGFAPVR